MMIREFAGGCPTRRPRIEKIRGVFNQVHEGDWN